MGADTNRRNAGHVVKFIASFLLGWFLTEKNFQDLSPVIGGFILALFYMVFLARRYFRSEKEQKEMLKARDQILPVIKDLRQKIEDGKIILLSDNSFAEPVKLTAKVAEDIIMRTEILLRLTENGAWTDEQESRDTKSIYLTVYASLLVVEAQLRRTTEDFLSAELLGSFGKMVKSVIYLENHKEPSVMEQFIEAADFIMQAFGEKNIPVMLSKLDISNQKFQAIIGQ